MRSRCWWLHSAGVLFFFPTSVMLLKLSTQYYVNVQSASIILASEDLDDAVFDSLAIAFIMDLDEVVWNFAKTILHLDGFESFIFRLWPSEKRKQEVDRSCFKPFLKWRVLHRGTGARRFENFLSFCVMFAMYFRILMNILFAIKTDTIPAARDVCLQWKWVTEGSPGNPIMAFLFRSVVNFLLLPFRPWWSAADVLSQRAEGICTTDHLETSQWHWMELATTYPCVTASACVTMVLLLIVPELFLEKGKLREMLLRLDFGNQADSKELNRALTTHAVELVQASSKGNSKRIDALQQEMAGLQAENASLHEEVQSLHERLLRAGL
mmetsp:Transcript_124205/g.359206  ORF Transcript_124205/g.359206 Transcript_124205/m.359206 type:complete len:325 (+) Transcript_124205:27-1001(+)